MKRCGEVVFWVVSAVLFLAFFVVLPMIGQIQCQHNLLTNDCYDGDATACVQKQEMEQSPIAHKLLGIKL